MRSEDAYLLGSGDQLKIDMFETPEIVLEPRYQVLPDGTVNLPWIGGVTVKGLTLGQAAELLNTRYKRFIKRPTVTVSLTAPRALKIGVIGEVKRPGVHLLSLINNESSQSSLSQRSGSDAGSQWPTVSKAIQTAGGITQRGNIRNIQVRRQVAAGQSELINVDLFKFLREGDLAQDILLRDGDSLIVSELTNFDPLEATQVARSNLSPEAIRVNVVGEVVTPGSVAVPPNATLNQAILTAGGLRAGRARKNNVELIRLNPNGSVSVQKIAIDFTQDLNSKSNPPIYDNDIIVVNRNGLTKFTDNLGSVLAPVNGLFGLFSIFGGR
jgi:polysaccharide biosynthesis/export protein